MHRVWDPLVRVLHWLLVASVAMAALSTVMYFSLHQPAGYLALVVVAIRIGWGFAGRSHARFGAFVRGPRATWRYAHAVLRHREARHVGHNPLGAWMVLALIACIAGLALTGWLYTTDAFWGDALVEAVHRALAWSLLVLVSLHIAGVLHASFRHRENLVASMIDGKKREADANDIA